MNRITILGYTTTMIVSGTLPLLLLRYKYILILPISIIEGPIITLIAGFLAAQGYLNMYVLFVIFILGDALGDSLYYTLGRYGGTKVIKRWGHRIGATSERVEQISNQFKRNDIKILLLSKTQPVGSFTLMAAGVSKMNFWRFNLINFLASIPKVIIFLLLGYYFGAQYSKINGYIEKVGIIFTLVLVIVGVFYFFHLRKKK